MKKVNTGKLVLALALGLLVGLMPATGFGQAISGDLVGTVVDASGAAVNGATVEITNVATGFKTSTTTRGNGEYRFSNLSIGRYNISASAPNFSPSTLQGVPVELNKTNTANLSLKVGEVTTTVEVSGAAPPIDTTTAQVQTTYSERQAQDLPIASQGGATGSGVLNLSLLQAGVASSGALGAGTGPSVGGQRPRNNNFTVEGVDNNDKSVTGPSAYIPNDAVANFTILQNQFSPEFGHSSGGQFNTVVQSGTNNWHGMAYEYFRNRKLNALDELYKRQGETEVPRYDNNRYGGQIGGPLVKNKLFFFTNVEYNTVGQASSAGAAVQTPTAAGLATISGLPGISATNLGVFTQYAPVAGAQDNTCGDAGTAPCTITVGGQEIPVGTVSVVAPNYLNQLAYVQSLDWNISDRDQLRGRYIFNRFTQIDTAAQLESFFTTIPVRSHLINVSEYHTFSPAISNEFRVGFNRKFQDFPAGDFTYPGLDAFPNIQIDDLGGGLQLGPDPNAPQFGIQNFYQAVDNLSWTKGKHTMKFGVEARKYISPQSFTQRARGDYEYGSLDLFLRDISPNQLGERSLGNLTYYGDQSAIYWFVNDQWRVNQNLTVNLGLRHEYTTIPTGERLQRLNAIANAPEINTTSGPLLFEEPRAPKTNFMPRVGIAYSPGSSGNTSIRAGFGLAYDVLYDNIGILSLPPELSTTVDIDLNNPVAGFLAGGGIPNNNQVGFVEYPDAATARLNTANWIPRDKKYPYSVQWNLGVQHSFGRSYSAEVRYVGTHGIHLNVQNRLNAQAETTPNVNIPTDFTAPTQADLDARTTNLGQIFNGTTLVPEYNAAGFNGSYLTAFMPLGSSIYHGLQTQLNRRFDNGLQFQVAYTWSHTIDNSTADFFSTVLTPRRPQDFQNWNAERGTSALDRRHRVSVSAIYDMPFLKNSNWFLKNVVGNWQFSPIYTYESPEYGTVVSQRDSNVNGDSAGDRAIYNPDGVAGTGSDVSPLCTSAAAPGSCTLDELELGTLDPAFVVGWLVNDPSAQYIATGYGSLPNVGRNTLRTRPINNVDLSLVKRISFTERYQIDFAAGAFNLLNHPQFVPGAINDVLSVSDTNSSTRNMLTPGNELFNHPEQVFASNSRTIQFGLKFIF